MTRVIFAIALVAFIANTKAYSKSITCKTSNKLKIFKIAGKKVTFINEDEASRSIASEKKVRSRFTRMGFTKTVNVEGKEHIFHINNKNNFSNLEDYYIIRNHKGHEVIYPLDCSNSE